MELTRKGALKLHRRMWKDMQEKLGDNPTDDDREEFKIQWCEEHGYADIACNCFICEYACQEKLNCRDCIIKWGTDTGSCMGACENDNGERATNACYEMPISWVLAQPERAEE